MNPQPCLSRRRLLKRLALAVSLAPLAASRVRSALAADAPLLASSAPEARAVKYVEDAREAGAATAGSNCANCGLYQGPSVPPRGRASCSPASR